MDGSGVSNAHQGGPVALPASSNLAHWVLTHARRTPQAPAVASSDHRLTYAELAMRVRSLAAELAAAGVGPGTSVLLVLPNSPATVVAGLALNLLGAISLEIGRDRGAEPLVEIVERVGVEHAFVAARDLPKLGTALAATGLEHVWALHDGPLAAGLRQRLPGVALEAIAADGSLEKPAPATLPPPPATADPDPDRAALVLHTSGSLGRPVGVIQTFRNIDANTRAIVEYLGLGPGDRAMLTLPLHYCYGRSVLQTHLLVGGSVFLDHRMAFPRTVLEAMAAEGCTGFAGVPLTFEVIKRQVDVTAMSFPRLRYLTQAGGAMPDEMIDWVRQAFAPAQLFVMYGQTEATARLTYLPPERARDKRGSIGIAIPGVELRVVGDDGGETATGSVGQIVARGANVTPGYLDDPEGTARILRDGWLRTGDLAERDADGYLYHRGRASEILKVGGHRVSPADIERVLKGHDVVAEAVVFGEPDELLGEAPVAVVVPHAGVELGERDLLRYCQPRLAPRQVPVRFIIVSSVPRNAAGKPQRAEVARLHGGGKAG